MVKSNRLEQQLTPWTLAWKRQRIALAKRGLADLAKFDRGKMSESERVSVNVMQWQLQSLVDEGPYLDYTFPLNQFDGVNVATIQALTVVHPLQTEKDAANYIAATSQAGERLDEAMAESRRLAAKGIVPPKFILEATIHQMQSFIDGSPGQNPLVTVLAKRCGRSSPCPAHARRSSARTPRWLWPAMFTRLGEKASRSCNPNYRVRTTMPVSGG